MRGMARGSVWLVLGLGVLNVGMVVAPPSNIFGLIGSSSASSIVKFDLSSSVSPSTSTFSTGLPTNIVGITISPDGDIAYFAAGNRIYSLLLSQTTNTPTIIAGSSTAGLVDATGTSARFNSPYSLDISSDGQYLLIPSQNCHCIQKLVLSTLAVTKVAGSGANGAACSATACTAGNVDGPGSISQFNDPYGLSIHPSQGWALIADTSNHAIRSINLLDGKFTVSTVVKGGTATETDGSFSTATLNWPLTVSFYGDGNNAYVYTYSGRKIRLLNFVTGQVTTYASPATTQAYYAVPPVDGSFTLLNDVPGNQIVRYNPTATNYITGLTNPLSIALYKCNTAGYGTDTSIYTCSQCPAGKYGGGTSGTGGRCVTCSAGSWSAAGASTCTLCAGGTYRTATGGTAASDCTGCGSGLWSAPGSSSSSACVGCAPVSGSQISSATATKGTEFTDVPGYRVHQ